MDLRERIENIEGWDCETQELMDELDPEGDYYFVVDCGVNYRPQVLCLRAHNRNCAIDYEYSNDDEKLRAFRKALLLIAKREGKLDPPKPAKPSAICADLQDILNKANALSEGLRDYIKNRR